MRLNKVLIRAARLGLLILALTALQSCQQTPPAVDDASENRQLTILHINDVYRISGVNDGQVGALSRVRTLRRELEEQYGEVLVLHGGDFLFPSLLSREYEGQQMVDMMNRLDGDAQQFDPHMFVVFGNHEFDKGRLKHAELLSARINEAQFQWLDTNLDWRLDDAGKPLVSSPNKVQNRLMEIGGIKVGLFGLTIDTVQPAYATIDGDYVETARRLTRQLRSAGAEVVIALTHISVSRDSQILDVLGSDGPDIIFGGHDHSRQHVNVNGRYVLKADADARSAVVAQIEVNENNEIVNTSYEFKPLDASVAVDPQLHSRAVYWQSSFMALFCARNSASPGDNDCLDKPLGRTNVTLVAEEQQIRMHETNLGNFLSDLALQAYADQGAQIAFIHSGSLRLNQDIPEGTDITERHLVEIFQFPSELRLFKMTGAQLQAAIDHSIEDWSGMGWWLQIAGFSFVHDPVRKTATQLKIREQGIWRLVDAEEEILAVTGTYLLNRKAGQDGYTMLDPQTMVETGIPYPQVVDLARQAVRQAGDEGITPGVDGRICNVSMPSKACLAQ